MSKKDIYDLRQEALQLLREGNTKREVQQITVDRGALVKIVGYAVRQLNMQLGEQDAKDREGKKGNESNEERIRGEERGASILRIEKQRDDQRSREKRGQEKIQK